MSVPLKPNLLQSYQVILYGRALHPELFQLRGRRTIRTEGYEAEGWIMPGAHLLRFERKSLCACELVTAQDSGLPENGVVSAFLCAGERDYEHTFEKPGVTYINTVQTETLSENLYLATYQELLDYAREVDALTHEWEDEAGRCLSILDLERHAQEVHASGFHLIAQGGLVLRTQTIFEHI